MTMYFQDDFWEAAQELPDEERDRFISAAVVYFYTGEEPSLSGVARGYFRLIKDRLDLSRERKQNGSKGGSKQASKSTSKRTSKQGSKSTSKIEFCQGESEIESKNNKESERKKELFTPPTLDDVQAYSIEQGITLDCERFIDYYTAQGWKLSNGNKMKDWRAACRNWARRSKPEEVYHSEYD